MTFRHCHLVIVLMFSLNALCDPVSDSLEAKLGNVNGEEKFNTLVELAKRFSRTDLQKSYGYAEQAYNFALESENREWESVSLNSLAIINYNMGNNYRALKYFQQYIELVNELLENNPDSDALNNRLLTGYNNIGNIYKNLGEHEKAMNAFLDGLRYMDSLPSGQPPPSLYLKLMNNLSLVYIDLGEYEKAKEILSRALALSRQNGMDLEISITLNNLGLVAIDNNDFEPALEYYREAVEIGKKLGDSMALGGYYNNIGLIYEKQQKWEEALEFYQKSLSISRNLGYPWGIANTLGNIANIEMEMKRYHIAGGKLNEALEIASSTGIKDLIRKIYSYLYELYERQDMPAEALKYHLLYTQVKDSIFNEERSRRIAEMETKYETEKKEKENELLKKDIKIQKTTRNLLIIVIMGLIALSVLLFQLFRWRTISLRKEKEVRKLESDKKEIEKKRLEEQVFAEKQINRLQREKLEQKNRELTANVIHIINKNNALKEILVQMESLKNSGNDEKDKCYSRLTGLINNNLNLDNEWEQFKLHFSEVHPSFFGIIQKRFPALTPNEQRLCAYIRINLNTKEIAQMLNVSPDAVVKSRYRLRKKLEVSSETDLVEFMGRM